MVKLFFVTTLLGQVDVPQVESSTFWTLFLSIVALPFLAKAMDLGFNLFIQWRAAKSDKNAAAYQRYWAMAGDAVAYVNAQTKATQSKVTAPGSEAGTGVSPAEAKELQSAALKAMLEWVGTPNAKAAVSKEVGVAADQVEGWLTGLIQKRFEAQKTVSALGKATP